MPAARILDEWVEAARSGVSFEGSGEWGELSGVLVYAAPPQRGGLFRRAPAPAAPTVALIAPQAPGLEQAEEAAHVEDALAAGLLRAGVHVARARTLRLATPAEIDPLAWVDAIVQAQHAATSLVAGARPALAGAWLAGAACALAVARREELAFVVLAGAPAAEVMSRRTAENEDDPAWEASPTLRLVDALAALQPLQAITMQPRPVLLVQGSCDESLPAAHLESWRAALAAAGRPAEGVEVAFADSFFRMLDDAGAPDLESDEGQALLADAVAEWTARTISAAAARPPR
jgi:hypothetical protein